MALFPTVPNVPGVPPLPRNPLAIVLPVALLVRDAIALIFGLFGTRWGLYQDGVPIIQADTVLSFDYKQTATVATYPVEEGAFESYDKVQSPFDVRLRFATGGTEFARQQMLNDIAAAMASLDLFDAVTPEKVYPSVNVVHYDYRRTATNGVGLLVVDVWCQQIRAAAAPAFANTKEPNGADTVGGGTVQPTTMDPGAEEKFAAFT